MLLSAAASRPAAASSFLNCNMHQRSGTLECSQQQLFEGRLRQPLTLSSMHRVNSGLLTSSACLSLASGTPASDPEPSVWKQLEGTAQLQVWQQCNVSIVKGSHQAQA